MFYKIKSSHTITRRRSFDLKKYTGEIKTVIDDSDVRFCVFENFEDVIPSISFPFKGDYETTRFFKIN